MGSSVVVKADPISDRPAGVLQRLEAMPVRALLFQGSNHALDHAVLLGAVGRDEFLTQAKEAMEKVPVLEALVKDLSTNKEKELAEMISPKAAPTYVWLKSRASESKENVVDETKAEDAQLKKSAPEVPWLSAVTGTTPLQQ